MRPYQKMLNQTQELISKDIFGRKESIIDPYTIILYIKLEKISTKLRNSKSTGEQKAQYAESPIEPPGQLPAPADDRA